MSNFFNFNEKLLDCYLFFIYFISNYNKIILIILILNISLWSIESLPVVQLLLGDYKIKK